MVLAGRIILLALAAAVPEGMVRVPGGTFVMGRDAGRHADEAPAHEVALDPYYLDATLVTLADFSRFVEETKYVTSAEKLGFGMTAFEGMKDWAWKRVPGATFRAPWGRADIPLQPDFPVVMVSWIDADAYCRHYGKRLPTEAEWEFAMRSGASKMNYWQGRGHEHNSRDDGYVYLSPVRAFPPNEYGIYDPLGNAWQWVADYYSAETYGRDRARGVVKNPRGPAEGTKRVSRGGSWWCSATTCHGFTPYARGKNEPDAVFSNNGFRCAKSVAAEEGVR